MAYRFITKKVYNKVIRQRYVVQKPVEKNEKIQEEEVKKVFETPVVKPVVEMEHIETFIAPEEIIVSSPKKEEEINKTEIQVETDKSKPNRKKKVEGTEQKPKKNRKKENK